MKYTNNSNNQVIKKKFKLKKKWRFWRVFKRYCLLRGTSTRFFKFRLVFDRKRVIWYNFRNVYGSQAKHWTYYRRFKKFACGVRFLKVLVQLETRLNVFALRVGFEKTLTAVNSLINSCFLIVNNQYKTKNFLVTNGDLVYRSLPTWIYTKKLFFDPRVKFFFARRANWRTKRKFKYFWRIKKTGLMNYALINYKINSVVLVRKPLMGELILNRDKRLLSWQLIKKIYLLY